MKKRFLYLRYYLKHLHHKFRAKRGGMYSIMHTKFLGKMPPSDEEAEPSDQGDDHKRQAVRSVPSRKRRVHLDAAV